MFDHTQSATALLDRSQHGLPDTLSSVPAAVVAVCGQRFAPAPPDERPSVESPEAAMVVLGPHLHGRDREHCVAALLDTKHRLLTVALVSIGTIDHTFMSPREILREALLANAAAIVVAHNHPSGDAEPSKDDEAVTRRLSKAAEVVGIELLDHLVVADGQWTSLARRGFI